MTPPSSPVRLRRATTEDAARVAEIYLTSVHVSLPWLRLAHTDDQVRDWIRRYVVHELETWVAELDGSVVAMVVVTPPRTANEAAWVEQFYVDPEYQRRGVGDRLLELARERHPHGLQLWTFQRNARARAFYEHRGFVAVELTDGAGNEEREPDVRYVWPGPTVQ